MTTGSSILAWKIPWRGAWQAAAHGVAELDLTEHTHTQSQQPASQQGGTSSAGSGGCWGLRPGSISPLQEAAAHLVSHDSP